MTLEQSRIDAARLLGRIRTYHGVQIPEPAARMAVDLIADLLAERDAELVRWVHRFDELKHQNQCLHNRIDVLLDEIEAAAPKLDDDTPTFAELTDMATERGGPG